MHCFVSMSIALYPLLSTSLTRCPVLCPWAWHYYLLSTRPNPEHLPAWLKIIDQDALCWVLEHDTIYSSAYDQVKPQTSQHYWKLMTRVPCVVFLSMALYSSAYSQVNTENIPAWLKIIDQDALCCVLEHGTIYSSAYSQVNTENIPAWLKIIDQDALCCVLEHDTIYSFTYDQVKPKKHPSMTEKYWPGCPVLCSWAWH